jgi:transcriptional regulator with XRE-family HTH domain
MKHSIGKRIAHLREHADLTQEDLASCLQVDRAVISQIENDHRPLKADEVLKLSRLFNISTDLLLGTEPLTEVILEATKKTGKKSHAVRIHVPAKNVRKFREVLLYILSKVGAKPNIGETVVYKLLYFIDFNYYEKYEEQLIGATYIKNHFGPTPIEFQEIVKDMVKTKELEKVTSVYFQREQKKYLPCRQADLTVLNAQEIKLIDEVLEKLSGMNAKAISEYSHGDVPWIVTPQNRAIEYESVFYRTSPYSVRETDAAKFSQS